MLTASLLVFAAALTTTAGAASTGLPEPEDTTEPLPPNVFPVEHAIVKRSVVCKVGWASANGRCFLYVPTLLSWGDAEGNCQFRGGNLASVHSLHEYELIQNLIKKISRSYPITWLGGSDGQQEGSWFWNDGSCFNFNYWSQGQPDNYNNEDCLEMNYGGQRKFNDRPCKEKRPSICAINPCDLTG